MIKKRHILLITKVLFFVVICFVLKKLIISDSYIVPSPSMIPTIVPGDRIRVDKYVFGGRILMPYKEENKVVSCIRFPGLGKIEPNDVIVFNLPYDKFGNLQFDITNRYCKRVLGTPGDRIGAVDGHYWNDRALKPIGVLEEQEKLRWMFDSVFIWLGMYEVLPCPKSNWNIKNWGPIIVPSKGASLPINEFTRELYRQIIEYETGTVLDDSVSFYQFQDDYYFGVGDNVMNSYDSRFWGFIPEEFIIGVVGGIKSNKRSNMIEADYNDMNEKKSE